MFPADVNVAFQQAAHKVLLDDDNLLPLLHLTVDYQGKDGKGELGPSGGWRLQEPGADVSLGGVQRHPVVLYCKTSDADVATSSRTDP